MRTTTNLGLKVWNLPTDEFNPNDLEDNWDAIDADAGGSRPANRVEKLSSDLALSVLPTLANTTADIGRLIYLDIAATGFNQHTIVRWNGTAWREISAPVILGSLPTTGNYQGRVVVLSASAGGFAANDVVVNTDGANAWKKVGGVASGTALPGSPLAGDVFLLTSAAGGFEAYTFVAYNGSAWTRIEKRGVEVGTTLPGSPYAGQIFVVTAAVSGFQAYDVARYNGSSWALTNTTPRLTSAGITALGTPINGYEVILVDSATAPTYAWRLIYDTGISDANKWVFVGGSSARNSDDALVNSAAGTGVWSSALGMSVTVPRAGVYKVHFGGRSSGNAGGTASYLGVGFGAAPAGSDYIDVNNATGGNVMTSRLKISLAASTVIDLYIQDTDATRRISFSNRWLEVVPVRVA